MIVQNNDYPQSDSGMMKSQAFGGANHPWDKAIASVYGMAVGGEELKAWVVACYDSTLHGRRRVFLRESSIRE